MILLADLSLFIRDIELLYAFYAKHVASVNLPQSKHIGVGPSSQPKPIGGSEGNLSTAVSPPSLRRSRQTTPESSGLPSSRRPTPPPPSKRLKSRDPSDRQPSSRPSSPAGGAPANTAAEHEKFP